MDKKELIATIAERTGLPKTAVTNVINTAMDLTIETLQNGDRLQMIGFGTFEVKTRPARTGRNPQTKEPMDIPEKKNPVFKFSPALKKKHFA